MIISEFGKPVTAKSLNESLAKRFGSKIKLENFTLEQLQDARNKIRTKLSQIEMSESFNTVVEGDDYQKSKLFLFYIHLMWQKNCQIYLLCFVNRIFVNFRRREHSIHAKNEVEIVKKKKVTFHS